MDEEKLEHVRSVYNIMDFLGDIGGIVEIITLIFGVLLFRISLN